MAKGIGKQIAGVRLCVAVPVPARFGISCLEDGLSFTRLGPFTPTTGRKRPQPGKAEAVFQATDAESGRNRHGHTKPNASDLFPNTLCHYYGNDLSLRPLNRGARS